MALGAMPAPAVLITVIPSAAVATADFVSPAKGMPGATAVVACPPSYTTV